MIWLKGVWGLVSGADPMVQRVLAVLAAAVATFAILGAFAQFVESRSVRAERAEQAARNATAQAEQLKERMHHDQVVRGLSDCDLIIELGGVRDDGCP